MLASVLPQARIMTFGYNADIFRTVNKADLRDHAMTLLGRLDIQRSTVSVRRDIWVSVKAVEKSLTQLDVGVTDKEADNLHWTQSWRYCH